MIYCRFCFFSKSILYKNNPAHGSTLHNFCAVIWLDLGLLFSLVLMGMLEFGSLAYYIENEEEDTGFYSIPQVIIPNSL